METVVPPPADAELHLLTDWGNPADRARMGRSAVLSLLAHAAAVVFLLVMPETFMQPKHKETPITILTPLFLPRIRVNLPESDAPKTSHEIRTSELKPRLPLPTAPTPEPQAPAPRKGAAAPPQPPPRTSPATPLAEPPKVDIAANEPPKLTLPVQPPAVQDPKARPQFENVSPPGPIDAVPPSQRVIELPDTSVAGAIRGSMRGPGGTIPGKSQIPSAGDELPQLLSDPKGVDFAPYLLHVRNSVKRYWDIIMPQSVTIGKRSGTVCVQFAIQRDGTVRTTAYCQQTGDRALDNAAVQAISGGSPFGSLPAAYKPGPGQRDEIHVQMNFAYNVPIH